MTSLELRAPTVDEMGQVGLIGSYVYGGAFGDGADSLVATANRPEWMLCAFDGDRMAASYCTIPFTMRANGKAVPLGGVSAVGTLPEYRRQGLVRSLVTRSFEDMHDAGRPVAALWASQAAIYQRYGYAAAGVLRSYSVDTVDIAFADGDAGRGDVERHGVEAGYELAKPVYNRFVADRSGYLHRGRLLWLDNVLAERAAADGPVHVAVSRDSSGQPDAYAVYTLRSDRVDHAARSQEIVVRDLAWLDLDGYRSLWGWFARHDLVGRVRWENAPADDPAPELFAEPRMLRTRDGEGTWLRVVDVPAALAARGYAADGEISIRVASDDLAPWNEGTWGLAVAGGDATVARVTDADVVVSPRAMSSLYSGFRSARRLAAWGLLTGTPAAVSRAEALFATHHAPHCPDHF